MTLTRRRSVVVLSLIALAPAAAAPPTTATAPALVPGLVMDVYDLPRMPTRLRRLIPGARPAVSRIVTRLRLPDKAAFGGHDEQFQMLLRGFIDIETAGTYAFRLNTDDGSELLIGGRRVVLNDGVHGQNPGVSGTVALNPGRHPVLVRYFQADYGFGFNLTWKPPGADDFTAIPPDRLRADPAEVRPPATRPATRATVDDLDAVAYHVCTSAGFGELNEKSGDLLIALLDSPNQVSQRARKAIGKMLADVNYDALSKENQGRFLKGFLQSTFGFQVSRSFDGERAVVDFGPETEADASFWNGRRQKGYRTVARLDGRDLVLDAAKPGLPEVKRAALAIASLPAHLRRYVKRLVVDPSRQNQYNGGGDTIWVRLDRSPPQGQIDNVFAHEIGHVLASHDGDEDAWQTAMEADLVPVSGYGNRNRSEDFAEFCLLYLSCANDPAAVESLKVLYPNRYPAFMKVWDKSVAGFERTTPTTRPAGGD